MSPSSHPFYRQRGFHLLCLAWAALALLTALLPAADAPATPTPALAAAPQP